MGDGVLKRPFRAPREVGIDHSCITSLRGNDSTNGKRHKRKTKETAGGEITAHTAGSRSK